MGTEKPVRLPFRDSWLRGRSMDWKVQISRDTAGGAREAEKAGREGLCQS
jgi:hypothetical protein